MTKEAQRIMEALSLALGDTAEAGVSLDNEPVVRLFVDHAGDRLVVELSAGDAEHWAQALSHFARAARSLAALKGEG